MASTSCTPRTARRSPTRGFLPTSPLRGTTAGSVNTLDGTSISIHVSLAGDDLRRSARGRCAGYFYPRPPCGGRLVVDRRSRRQTISIHVPLAGDDGPRSSIALQTGIFLSTSPLRGTTGYVLKGIFCVCHFYPRPPCGGRPAKAAAVCLSVQFLSTSPLRGTTTACGRVGAGAVISIHVPLAGDDTAGRPHPKPAAHFYPRPPCGGRPQRVCSVWPR